MAQQQGRRAPKKQVHKAVSKKRKFVKDGVFYAELNDFLGNELSEQGYAGCEVRVTPHRTEIIIRATNSAEVIGDNGRRIRELTALIQKRFKFPKNGLICFAEKVRNKGFSALTQAQAVKYRLLTGLTVRRAAYSCLKYIMDSEKKNGALGCEIVVSGKLRGQRAKGMKFRDGFMIHAGDAANYYIDQAVKHVHLPQGVIGIKVKIMKPYDATGRDGVALDLPDKIQILDPKDESYNQDEMATDRQEMREHLHNLRPTGGPGGPGPHGGTGGAGMGGAPQPPQQPMPPPQQPIPPPQYDNEFGSGQAPAQQQQQQAMAPQQPAAPVMDAQYGMGTQQQQQQQHGYGGQAVQQGQDFAQGGQQQQQFNNAPNTQQFDQYGQGGQGGQGQAQDGQQFQQFDNQYQQPMQQQQQYPPAQQPYQGQQQTQQSQYQNQQYYDQNRGGNYYQQ